MWDSTWPFQFGLGYLRVLAPVPDVPVDCEILKECPSDKCLRMDLSVDGGKVWTACAALPGGKRRGHQVKNSLDLIT